MMAQITQSSSHLARSQARTFREKYAHLHPGCVDNQCQSTRMPRSRHLTT